MRHSYHLVDESPWPIISSIGAFFMTSGLLVWFHVSDPSLFLLASCLTLISGGQWWQDISSEGGHQGLHSKMVELGLRYGMLLFIMSEVMFFLSFFWAFFHSSLSPCIEIGSIWPPKGILPFNAFEVPLLNTLILLTSGMTVTWSHYSMLAMNHKSTYMSLVVTIFLGLYFTSIQAMEYFEASFSMADSVYGSTFFIATGFHGIHVIVGTLFLSVCLIRLVNGQFSAFHHFGFEAAVWYWHFVDVVWLFLFMVIYWWGGI